VNEELLQRVKRSTWKEPYAWPGGYELRVVMSDGGVLCRQCVKDNWREIVQATLHGLRDGWEAAAVDVLWEGPAVCCAQCGCELPTEYGDPAVSDSLDNRTG